MPISKGTTDIGAVFKGTTEIASVYKGTTLVYENYNTLTADGVPPLTLNNCKNTNMLGYQVYGNSVQNGLPSGYTQLEYIESTGTQYIDTGITATNNTGMSIKYCYTASGLAGISGIFKSAAPRQDVFFISTSNGQTNSNIFCAHRGATFSTSTSITLNTDYTCEINYLNSGKVYFDNTLLGDVGSNNVYDKTIPLFARYSVGSSSYSISNSRIYYAEFSEGTVITHKFVPAKDINGVIGMYDTITNIFHENVGTGTFTAGDEVVNPNNPIEIESVGDKVSELPYGYTELDYVESTGTQYIDTGVIPDNTTGFKLSVSLPEVNSDVIRFGCRQTTGDTGFFVGSYNGNAYFRFGQLISGSSVGSIVANEKFDAYLNYYNDRYAYINDNTKNQIDDISSITFTYSLIMFGRKALGNISASAQKVYKCQITKGNQLIRNFIPSKNSSNVVGMYDTVTNQFYTNQGTGEFIAGNEVARGGYKIPITVTNSNNETTTTNIYLSEPLRKISDYVDYIDFETQKVIRNVKETVVTGSEDSWNFISTGGANIARFYISYNQIIPTGINMQYQLCNYFVCKTIATSNQEKGASVYYSGTISPSGTIFRVRYDGITNLSTAKAFFKDLYDAGTPVKIYYPLSNYSEESVILPDILLNKGTNIVNVGTNLTPSDTWIKYKGKQ